MSHSVPWTRPYPGLSKLPPTQIKRITVELPMDDAHAILAVTMSPFLLPALCQHAVKLTAQEIRDLSVSYPHDSAEYLQHIFNRTYSQFARKTSGQDDVGGTPGARAGAATNGGKSAESVEETSGRKRGKGKK